MKCDLKSMTSLLMRTIALVFFLMLSIGSTINHAGSLSIQTDKGVYNIGDYISVFGTADPNASLSIRIFDPSGLLKANVSAVADINGTYSAQAIYMLRLTDEPGDWNIQLFSAASNGTAQKSFKVIPIWERIESLGNEISELRSITDMLRERVADLEALVNSLSSGMVGVQSTLSWLTYLIYGAIAVSAVSAVVSTLALLQYLRKREVYMRIVGKTEKPKRR
ncbi:MAG: hypothetical protein RMJ07_06755 [Nitrososphaerota archaeon]|nr:hypothetical protein [Candidatus Bathyarchaeota archaeon]MDW8049354.1 hypothetical protein [Nitrososphaerota archaeon]